MNAVPRLLQEDLHNLFLKSLGDAVISHSDIEEKPIEIDLKPPLPHSIRLYMYNLTHPPGGRTLGEHKIQLIVPGQGRGQYASFDSSDGRIVILCGFEPELEVFTLWDSGMYPSFSYSRNVQVKPETVYAALAGKLSTQKRYIRGMGEETVITATPKLLGRALQLRISLTRERLIKA